MGDFALWVIMIVVCAYMAPALYSIAKSLKQIAERDDQ